MPGQEARLRTNIIKKLRERGGFWAVVHQSGYQIKGLPDIVGSYEGWFFALEVKVPGREKTLTERQAHVIDQINRGGAVSAMVSSVDDALKVTQVINCPKCRQFKPRPHFLGWLSDKPRGGIKNWCKDCRGERRLQRTYGLSAEDIAQLLNEQGGVCGVCGNSPKRPVVDHNHKTGEVRGILCTRCNSIVGVVESERKRLKGALQWVLRRS